MTEFEAPGLTAADPMGRIKEVEDYLWYLKERLEFVLGDIGMENFSQDFRRRLAAMGADISGARDMAGIGEQRVANVEGKSLTVSDVINSEMYKQSMKSMGDGLRREMADGGAGYLGVCDGTLILYGTGQAGDVVFGREFAEPPVVFTMPQTAVIAHTGGFLAEGAGIFQWMAIGRGKEETENGT